MLWPRLIKFTTCTLEVLYNTHTSLFADQNSFTKNISHLVISYLVQFCLYNRWSLTVIFFLTEGYKESNSLYIYFQFTVHYTAILQYTFYTQLCVNNIEVTVNTCTCTDVFTVITIKDQSGGVYNSYSTGCQRFMAVVNECPRTQSVHCHYSLAPC